jgi:hypothetical protein
MALQGYPYCRTTEQYVDEETKSINLLTFLSASDDHSFVMIKIVDCIARIANEVCFGKRYAPEGGTKEN